jgi:flagellar motor switch protein FliM
MQLSAERDLKTTLRSAARVEPDRLPRLKLVGAEWAERLRAALAAEFGSPLEVEYAGAETLAPGAAPSLLLVAGSPGWPQPLLVTLDAGFGDLVAECLFGGDGSAAVAAPRALTELDRCFCRLVLERILAGGDAALSPVLETALAAREFVSLEAPARLQAILSEEGAAYVGLAFELRLGQLRSSVRAALPQGLLALHRRKLDHLPEPPAPPVDEAWSRDIEEGLLDAQMVVTALLDEMPTTLGALANFAVGQTIVLGTRIDGLITLECEDQRLFRGRIGRSRESYLVRIEEKIDPTEEFIDDILAD